MNLYRVMIVDDYMPILKYVEQLVDWQKLGLQVTATLHSSIKALESFDQVIPDILITDIDMPQLNGIELAKKCKTINPALRIIFLTCHEEFEYAKGALKLQADDYLVKDELTEEQLAASLNKSCEALATIQTAQAGFPYEEDLRNKTVLEKSFLHRLLQENENVADTLKFGEKLGLRWSKPAFLLTVGAIEQGTFIHQYERKDHAAIQYAFYNIANELAQQFSTQHPTIKISPFLLDSEHEPYTLLCIVNFEEQLAINVYSLIENVYLANVIDNMKNYIRVHARFTCSRRLTGAHNIRKIYKGFKSKEWDLYYEDLPVRYIEPRSTTKWNDVDTRFLAQFGDELFTKLKRKEYSEIHDSFLQVARKAKQSRIDPAQWLAACAHWIRLFHTETDIQISEDFYLDLQHSYRWSETVELMEQKMEAVTNSLSAKHRHRTKDPTMERVDQYIFDHISENITLAEMARHLYLNPNYFSRYFKKTSGQNFIDYVHRHKIELASKLLFNPYETVESVALKLGYRDRTYFARVFKKYMKVSPSVYRK